tara:strand:+ start:1313 stop:2071 length:759 start_codon:yes stop_codon:yes gene_type:complete
MSVSTITLCAGVGKRMNSDVPKCAVDLLGKPMINYVMESIKENEIEENYVIVGYKKEYMKKILSKFNLICFIEQEQQLGTGHAVQQALPYLSKSESDFVIVIMGDMPVVTPEFLRNIMESHKKSGSISTVVTITQDDPGKNARIIRKGSGEELTNIIEYKDIINENHYEIKEVNAGLYVFNRLELIEYLPKLTNNNNQNEYYLPDIIKLQLSDNLPINVFKADGEIITPIGANTMEELEQIGKNMLKARSVK